MATRPAVSFLLGLALTLAAHGSSLAAQSAQGPKRVSVVRLSPTEEVGTIQGLPSHRVRGPLSTQQPASPIERTETEETQPAVPVIDDGLNIPPAQTVETVGATTNQPQVPGTFVVLRDSSLAPTGNISNVAEPNVGSQGDGIFATHNWYAEVSTSNGNSFSYVSPYSTFPSSPTAFSAGFCCDQRVAQDSSHNLIFWYLQYIKTGSTSSSTNGVRLAVTHGQTGLANNAWVYYDFTPALFGLPAGLWLDFPQMQASANYLYFTTNIFYAVGNPSPFYGALVVRIPLSQLDTGSSITLNYLTVTGSYGSIMPVNGASAEGARPGRVTMYFAALYTTSSIKVLSWPESTNVLTINTVGGLASTNFATYVCPGPDGLDPCTRANSRMQTGWITDTELGIMWNAAQNGSARPYPYIRAVILDPTTLAVISQPDVFNTTSAWLYPAMSVNERGHLGGTADNLGGTQYPTIGAIIRDDFSPDPSTSGWEAHAIAGSNFGTAGLYGDYNGAMPHAKYPKTWLAAGHTQIGGSANSNAVTHNYWFGRERDDPIQLCYTLTRTHTGSGSDPTASPDNSSGCSSGQYHAGEVITLTASPSSGWSVVSWSGTNNDASTATTNTATMPAGSLAASVSYTQPSCSMLTRTHTGSGSDPTASPNNSSGCSSGQYHAGEVITLTASPSSGWSVVSWSGTNNDASTATMNSATMPAGNLTATVNYVQPRGTFFYTATPCRVLDTRSGSPLVGGSTYEVGIAGVCGVPPTATSVAANITVVGATADGFLTVWPAQTSRPNTSTIDFRAGQVLANNAVLSLAPGSSGSPGAVWVVFGGSGSVHLIIDISGYFQ